MIGATSVSVEVFVDLGGETVEGILQDADQKPLPLERVVLAPEQSRRQNFALFKTALTDSSGHFVFRGVAPGNYKVFGWSPSPQAHAHINEGFMVNQENLGHAVRVTKGFGERVTVLAIPHP
jgi:hypothetical protein